MLQWIGAAGLGATGCVGDDPNPDGGPVDAGDAPRFVHGVASGDPTQTAVILWTRVTPPTPSPPEIAVAWELSATEDFASVERSGVFRTSAQRDWTVKVDATDLTPGRTLYYRFRASGITSPVGRTRTAPEGATTRVRFAVCTCSNYAAGYFLAYRAIAATEALDAVVHLGDYIYEYPDGYYGNLRRYDPPHEIVTLRDYRRRYAHYRRDPDLQELHAKHPFIAVWDDHELANNTWRDGAEEHMAEREGPWRVRFAAAKQAYMEWMPLREQPDGRIFRALRFGDLAELVMLDTRAWGRDMQVHDRGGIRDPRRTLLGDDQERWMIERVTRSRARWKLLGQQVMVGQLGAFDYLDVWEGYPAARERLFNAMRSMGVSNIIVLTGDIHASFAMDLTSDPLDASRYDPATGRGSIAVEFVAPAVSSPSLPFLRATPPETLRRAMPHLKYSEATQNGWLLVEMTHERTAATWRYVGDVTRVDDSTAVDGPTFVTRDGANRLERG
jgi:alkaline phosphatase D